ncbi:serine hydrolase domain-containing protein [Lysobacter sp. TAF61]|uniref:serine hydrolase domain-containing protein n=1 Tax=Lysobacter sp. TAF61 TaxID=3233072 RepID=UPI003F9BFEEE
MPLPRIALFALLYPAAFAASAADACLAQAASSLDAAALKGQIVVSTLAPDGARDTRVLAAPTATPLKGDEAFRIASVTKTYVAATALRLHEAGKLDLRSTIDRYLPQPWLDQLKSDGYDPGAMTVRQLLSHTSGLADHAQAPQFIAAVKANPSTKWTPAEDVAHLVEWTQPVGKPGEKYSYSDTGYILLGTIIERVSGQSLPKAVRSQLALDKRGLPDTWWERAESARGRTRAHQFFEGDDTYDWDPSMDLFGGGGIVATPADMATFFEALLAGRVFKDSATLALMQSPVGLPADSPYRLGLLTYTFDGVGATGHSGFWGTLVVREPVSGRTIAGAVTRREEFDQLKALVGRYVGAANAAARAGAKAGCGS